MGLYAVDCYICGQAFMWWSGTMDQRCEACKTAKRYVKEDLEQTPKVDKKDEPEED